MTHTNDFKINFMIKVRGLDGVKNVLSAREKMWQNWQASEASLLRKREAVTRVSGYHKNTLDVSFKLTILYNKFIQNI